MRIRTARVRRWIIRAAAQIFGQAADGHGALPASAALLFLLSLVPAARSISGVGAASRAGDGTGSPRAGVAIRDAAVPRPAPVPLR